MPGLWIKMLFFLEKNTALCLRPPSPLLYTLDKKPTPRRGTRSVTPLASAALRLRSLRSLRQQESRPRSQVPIVFGVRSVMPIALALTSFAARCNGPAFAHCHSLPQGCYACHAACSARIPPCFAWFLCIAGFARWVDGYAVYGSGSTRGALFLIYRRLL